MGQFNTVPPVVSSFLASAIPVKAENEAYCIGGKPPDFWVNIKFDNLLLIFYTCKVASMYGWARLKMAACTN